MQTDLAKIYMWGSAECDQFLALVDGEEEVECPKPILMDYFIKNTINVIQICCGGLHTLFLTDQAKVYSQGCNDDGVLGRSEDVDPRLPGLVDLPPVDMICCGDVHSIAANSNGRVYFWGFYRNNNGPMGEKTYKPKEIGEFKSKISKILSGNNHTLILTKGKVYSCGDSDTNVLGRVSNTRNKINNSLKFQALGEKNVVDVFCGGYAAFIKRQKKDTYDYYAWGLNNYGQLGLGHTDNTFIPTQIHSFNGLDIVSIQGGEHHTIALDKNGDVYGFGRNDDGQLGIGEEINEELKQQALQFKQEQKDLPKKVKKSQKKEKESQLMSKQETDRVFGYEYITKPMKLNFSNVKSIKSTGFYSFAITNDDKIYSWGLGQNYVLGTRKEDSVFEPKEVPPQFFKNEHVLQLALGGQHVVTLTSADPKYAVPTINPELLIVPDTTSQKYKSTKTSKRKASKSVSKSEEDRGIKNLSEDKQLVHFTKQIRLE